jgi:chorismate mutase
MTALTTRLLDRTRASACTITPLESDRMSTPAGPPADPRRDLVALRQEIETVDARIVQLIAERTALARRIGEVKRAAGQPTLDPAREAAVVRRAGLLARAAGVAQEDVREIFWHLIGLSRRAQEGKS